MPSLNKIKTYYIVDDDRDDQNYLIEALSENDPDARFFTAANGQEALLFLQSGIAPLPDVIFLDLNMPRMNGRQCLTELKLSPALRDIPVIIYSTSSDKKEMQETITMGAAYFLVKRSNFHDLKEELSSIAATVLFPDPIKIIKR